MVNSLPLSKVKVLTQCLIGTSNVVIASLAACALLLAIGSAKIPYLSAK
jgi:hypothetical protein